MKTFSTHSKSSQSVARRQRLFQTPFYKQRKRSRTSLAVWLKNLDQLIAEQNADGLIETPIQAQNIGIQGNVTSSHIMNTSTSNDTLLFKSRMRRSLKKARRNAIVIPCLSSQVGFGPTLFEDETFQQPSYEEDSSREDDYSDSDCSQSIELNFQNINLEE